jgi:hypothetical protein
VLSDRGGVPVVLGLGAFERPAEHSAPFCYGLLVAFGADFSKRLDGSVDYPEETTNLL